MRPKIAVDFLSPEGDAQEQWLTAQVVIADFQGQEFRGTLETGPSANELTPSDAQSFVDRWRGIAELNGMGFDVSEDAVEFIDDSDLLAPIPVSHPLYGNTTLISTVSGLMQAAASSNRTKGGEHHGQNSER